MKYALICAYNEEKNIADVIKDTQKYVDKIIVVNDGSTDKTLEQIKDFNNVIIISDGTNRGKGHALIEGFKYFLSTNGKYLVTLDADKQHDPSQIPAVSMLVEKGVADLVIGSRFARKKESKMPIFRIFFNVGVNLTMILVTGSFFADVSSGFRCYTREAIEAISKELKVYDYGIEPEILVEATKHNLRIATVPITCHYITKENDSFMRLAKSYLKFAWRHKWDALKKMFRIN
ncbi:MAG: glycosyltransferase family 2 protein [Candidatus Aenigmarchaeota archaeon]|nr:glycosyltransferase family 2 protein [Candidatus Aenigmarchaeota archaeon]